MERVGIWGTSDKAQEAYRIAGDKYLVICFIDNNPLKAGSVFCGCPVIAPGAIGEYHIDRVIIASIYYEDIMKQAEGLGVRKISIYARWVNGGKKYGFLDDKFALSSLRSVLTQDRTREFSDHKMPSVPRWEAGKNVLVIAYLFPPIGGAGVQRALKFVKYLRCFGWNPVVLTVDECHYYWNDLEEELLKDIAGDIKIIRIHNRIFLPHQIKEKDFQDIYDIYAGIAEDQELVRQCFTEYCMQSERNILIPDGQLVWMIDALKQIGTILAEHHIGAVYATGAPFTDLIGGYYIKKKYDLPLIVDFRDLWAMSRDNRSIRNEYRKSLELEMERSICRSADRILVAAEEYLLPWDEVSRQENKGKFSVITNGYDEEEFADIPEHIGPGEDGRPFTICFGGTIYGDEAEESCFIDILDSINSLIEEDAVDPADIAFCIIGHSFDDVFIQRMKEQDTYRVLRWEGYLPHKEYIRRAYHASVLLLTLPFPEDFGAYVPRCKTYEYLRMKGTILAIIAKNSAIGSLLRQTGKGTVIEFGHNAEIKEFLSGQWKRWKEDSLKDSPDIAQEREGLTTSIEFFSRKYLTGKLACHLDEITSGEKEEN